MHDPRGLHGGDTGGASVEIVYPYDYQDLENEIVGPKINIHMQLSINSQYLGPIVTVGDQNQDGWCGYPGELLRGDYKWQ